MPNPVSRLKQILGELLLNGRQLLERMESQSQRLASIEADVSRLAEATAPRISVGHATAGRVAPQQVYFGLNELDRTLESYLDIDGGYFVELGANDGVAQSNTLHFERFRGWSGVLVEPTPHNFLKCLKTRSDRAKVFCCACTSFDYRERFVEIAFSNLMSTPVGLESDIADPRAHAELGHQFLAPSERVFSFGALARPLNDLLMEAGSPAWIDLLSLDVEGAEIEVLKGIDHGRYRFRYICVECRDFDRIAAYLGQHGYSFVAQLTVHDYLFRDDRAA
ncbi:MAG: FkbM family methyltransferase [Beijerinckiaceae bacterium]|jgi:FkbM family methyltransferase|nr:FkbM family methyltransferase [Beijerinckiaceae bacterium]